MEREEILKILNDYKSGKIKSQLANDLIISLIGESQQEEPKTGKQPWKTQEDMARDDKIKDLIDKEAPPVKEVSHKNYQDSKQVVENPSGYDYRIVMEAENYVDLFEEGYKHALSQQPHKQVTGVKEAEELRQIFKNNSDCYINTIDESVEQAFSEDRFIKVFQEHASQLKGSKLSDSDIEKEADKYHEVTRGDMWAAIEHTAFTNGMKRYRDNHTSGDKE